MTFTGSVQNLIGNLIEMQEMLTSYDFVYKTKVLHYKKD